MNGPGRVACILACLAHAWWPGAAQAQTSTFRHRLPDGGSIQVALRPAIDAPARYEVIAIPGSDCAGMAPIVASYFKGLSGGRLWIPHKRHVDPWAWPAPSTCTPEFVRTDRLSRTLADVAEFAAQLEARTTLPIVLVGISEGAEVAMALAASWPKVAALVLVGSSGRHPALVLEELYREAGAMAQFNSLRRMVSNERIDDAAEVAGRVLGYWRDVFRWSAPTLDDLAHCTQLLVAIGERDVLLPRSVVKAIPNLARQRPWIRLVPEADHGLQAGPVDHLQGMWALVDAMPPVTNVCRRCSSRNDSAVDDGSVCPDNPASVCHGSSCARELSTNAQFHS